MRYWKCVENSGTLNCFTVGNIYETDDNGLCLKDDEGKQWFSYTLDAIEIKQQGCVFKEIDRCLWDIDFLNSLSNGNFTKSDLKEGDIVLTREGVRRIVFQNSVMSKGWTTDFLYFEEDLRHTREANRDIMEVIRNGHKIWKREEKSPTQLKLEELEKKQREIADEMEKLRKEM